MIDFTNKVATRITLYADISHRNNPAYVYAKQNDADSRYLIVDVAGMSGDIAVDGMAQLNATKPDGTHSYIAGTIEQDGTIVIGLTDQLLAVAGVISCDIRIAGSNYTTALTTSTFYIVVEESNYDSEAIKSENEYSGIAARAATIARDSAEAAQVSAEAASISASEAEGFAAEVEQRISEAISYIPEDGMPATHQWDGTVLTVTSASGTSSADLKGEKGDQGVQGEIGEPGKSAFAYAQEGGYTGNEANFIEELNDLSNLRTDVDSLKSVVYEELTIEDIDALFYEQ